MGSDALEAYLEQRGDHGRPPYSPESASSSPASKMRKLSLGWAEEGGGQRGGFLTRIEAV